MKALALIQPWASLWLSERKIHETRAWCSPYRGWVAVHATKTLDYDACIALGCDPLEDCPTGGMLGAVELLDIIRMSHTAPAHAEDERCGNWSPERYAWKRGRFVKLDRIIPFRGYQNLWNIVDPCVVQPLTQLIQALDLTQKPDAG